jgi:hypothetical protein
MQPRRVLLLVIVLALLAYNLWRWNHNRTAHLRPPSSAAMSVPSDPSGIASTLWSDYDAAASAASGPDIQYSAALQKLHSDEDSITDRNFKPNADTLANLRGCTLWLGYYRQTVNSPHPDANWKQLSSSHIESCTKNHADIAR